VHAEPEGLIVHQIAHGFFVVSMGILIFWLRRRGLTREPGWRSIQYAALFFLLWNIDAVVVHHLDERDAVFRVINAGSWNARVYFEPEVASVAVLYYLGKLDHLLCLPAAALLCFGLRQLLVRARRQQDGAGP
jgi:hypothetical protein